MSETMYKLNEAKFFWKKMNEEYKSDPVFTYYLSAFISAARSITWVMRSEYVHIDEWETWFDSKDATKEEMILLKKMNDMRIRTTKTNTLHTGTRALFDVKKEDITDDVKEFMKRLDRKKVTFTIEVNEDDSSVAKLNNDGVTITGKITNVFRKISDFPEDDILKVCRVYLDTLEKLVVECDSEFGDELEKQAVEGFSLKFTDPDLFK